MRHGAIIRYLLSSALSLVGNSIAGVVLPLVLLARTGDVLAAGSLAIICAVPQFVCGIAGGALLDRANRRTVCVAADLVSALSCALLPIIDSVCGLSFGWFCLMGLLGAIGDVPGMSARDALLPAVCEREGADLQRFVGANQSLHALVNVVGPALAALLIGYMNDTDALWITAACSLGAALVSLTIPREAGEPERRDAAERAGATGSAGVLVAARAVLLDGLSSLFGHDALLRCSTLLAFGISMIMGSLQGIVLPSYFTASGQPQMVGYVVAAMSAGMLMGSLLYTSASPRLRRRQWLVLSLAGMAVGMCALGTFPAPGLLLLAAAAVGFFAGPASALLGFFAYDRVPDARRGAAMGTLNALYLVVAPAGAFLGSVVIALVAVDGAGAVMAAAWLLVTAWALMARPLRNLNAPRPF